MHRRGLTNRTILDPGSSARVHAEHRGRFATEQILGSRVRLAEVVKPDYLYVVGCSLWSDVKIMLPTLPHVWARPGM